MPEQQVGRMATGRKQLRKKHMEEKPDKKVFDFTQEDEKKELSGSEDDVREGIVAQMLMLAGVIFSNTFN